MKIVDVCAFYSPDGGGVRTYVDQKLAIGPALGHEIVILAPGPHNRSETRGPGARIEWIAAPLFPLDRRYRYFADAAELQRRLDRERPDLVEASSPWRSATAVASWKSETPRVLVMHADPMAAYAYRWFESVASVAAIDRGLDLGWQYLRRLDQAFDAVTSPSASLSARLAGAGLHGVVTNPLGIEARLFSPSLRDPALRARLLARCALPPTATLLLGVGRHAPEKRWPMLVEAVTAVGFDHAIGLVLIGDGRDRARTVRQIDGNPHIHLLSPMANRSDLARIMASSDALVHGCEAETFSLVAAEAAASGLPLIVPDRGGASDHAHAQGGFCFASGDPVDAARAIRDFLIEGGPQSIQAPRTLAQHFEAQFRFYQSLISARALGAREVRIARSCSVSGCDRRFLFLVGHTHVRPRADVRGADRRRSRAPALPASRRFRGERVGAVWPAAPVGDAQRKERGTASERGRDLCLNSCSSIAISSAR